MVAAPLTQDGGPLAERPRERLPQPTVGPACGLVDHSDDQQRDDPVHLAIGMSVCLVC